MSPAFARPRPRPAPLPRYAPGWLGRVVPYAHAVAFVCGLQVLDGSRKHIPLDTRYDLCRNANGLRSVTQGRLTRGMGVGWRLAETWLAWMERDGMLAPVIPGVYGWPLIEARALVLLALVFQPTPPNVLDWAAPMFGLDKVARVENEQRIREMMK